LLGRQALQWHIDKISVSHVHGTVGKHQLHCLRPGMQAVG
jgi:hypothetical protein